MNDKCDLITSPFNENRQAIYINRGADGYYKFYNSQQSKCMNLHFNFRYSRKTCPYMDPISIYAYEKANNEIHSVSFRLSSMEYRYTYHFYYYYNNNKNYEGLAGTGIGVPSVDQNVTIDLLLNENGYIDMYIDGIKKYTYTNHKFEYIDSVYFLPPNTYYLYDTDYVYDDIFCYYGDKNLITSDYTPDYSKYFMWEEFTPYFTYGDNDIYSI